MAASSSSSSMTIDGFTYDVFLSFRGPDTRHVFTGSLWRALEDKGIHTFFDKEDIPKGKETTPSLLQSIEQSRMALVVLSPNYASSAFCLDELSHILDCIRGKGRLVWPIFYDVNPSDVRWLEGTYREAMDAHQAASWYDKDTLQKWKKALHEVANLSGTYFENGGGNQYEFIEQIVKEVSREIKPYTLYVADYPVGLESRLKEVCSLLELESNGVLMVGIHGVGGIGKTTLALAVYNNIADQFEGLCFLHDVRENSVKHGLQHLQENLLFKTIGLVIKLEDVSEGIPIIKQRLCRKKVLLILDDVDRLEQLEALVGGLDWFGPGSRVIITTRDKHLLRFHGVERTYEVQELNHRDALQLLSYRVFKQPNVDTAFEELLNRAVAYASGLPLALEVVGSNLFGKEKEEWKSTLDRYERIPPKEIQKILKISFDALAENEQSVFLDIACCFKGYELTEVQDILRGHYGHEMNYHIEVLIEKSLISISLDGKVTLHRLIEGMGKEIVLQESPIDPGKRSRLWNPEDIVQVLEENTGTSKTEIIHLDSPLSEVIEWDGEAFKKMEKLKTLIVRKCHFSRAPNHLPSSLRVLEWYGYPSPELPSNFERTKVYMFRISHRDPEVPPISQGVTEISRVPSQTLEIFIDVSSISQNVPEALQTFQRVTGDIVQISVEALQILQGVFQSWTTWILDGLQWTYEWVLQNLRSVYQADLTWILVGVMSNFVGLPCYALSPSFKCVIGGWNCFKLILYTVFCLVILTTICCGNQFSLFKRLPWLKNFVKFGKLSSLFNRLPWLKNFSKYVVFMFIAVYSTRYDKCLNGKPEKLSMISNAAFAMVSLSLSKLIKFGCEKGIFTYFLGCFAAQMYTIHWKLIFVVIFSGFPLFAMHSSSDSQPEADHGGQVNDSSSDSRPEVRSGGGDHQVND